jgi:hypothetical protein
LGKQNFYLLETRVSTGQDTLFGARNKTYSPTKQNCDVLEHFSDDDDGDNGDSLCPEASFT